MNTTILSLPNQHAMDDATTIGKAYELLLYMLNHAITYPITPLDFWRINKCLITYEHFRKYVPTYRDVERNINALAHLQNFNIKQAPSFLRQCVFTTITQNEIATYNYEFCALMERFVP